MAELTINRRISRGTSPPFEEWEALLSAFAIIEEVGPRFNTGKLLQRLEDNLLDGLRRRSVADGHALNWLSGSGQLRNEILKKIPVGGHNALEVINGFKELIAARNGLSSTWNTTVELSAESLVKQKLVHTRTDISNEYVTRKPTIYYYAQVSRDWARFFVELREIDARISMLTMKCVKEGRAICVDQDGSGWALQMPGYWENRSTLGGHLKAKFLLTSDLPKEWRFKDLDGQEREDRQKKAEAMRWLYGQYQLPERPENLRPRGTAAKTLAAKFGIQTKTVLEEIWNDAPISIWKRPGRHKNS